MNTHHDGTHSRIRELLTLHPEGLTFREISKALGGAEKRDNAISSALRRMTIVTGVLSAVREPSGKARYFLATNTHNPAQRPLLAVQILTAKWASIPEPMPGVLRHSSEGQGVPELS